MAVFKHVDFEVPNWGELASGPIAWASYRQTVLNLGPAAYWRLGESAGAATAADELGAYSGTYQGSVTLGEAGALAHDEDTAVGFDGSSAVVDCNLTSSAALAERTLIAWIIWLGPSSGSIGGVLCVMGDDGYSEGNGQNLLMVDNSGIPKAVAYTDGSSPPATGGNATDGLWHMQAATFEVTGSGYQTTLYWDGVQVDQQLDTAATGFEFASALTRIGCYKKNFSRYLQGSVDEPALFNRVLSAAEILDLYRRGKAELVLNG